MDEETQQILSLCSVYTDMVAKTIYPERFNLPFADGVHDKIFELIDGPDNKVAIAAPRGWGKTSIVALALITRWILFRLTGFIVYINKSHDAASLQTENLRRELVTNNMIRHHFGDFKSRGVEKSEFDETFSKKAWVAYNTLVWPRGAGQQVRGVLFRNDRPGLIVIDDLEDPEKIENPDLREKNFKWLYADVVKAVPRIGPMAENYKIVYIDTLKHEDSVLQRLLESPEWKSARLEACDDNFKSTAPEFVSDEEIAKEWQAHVDAGQTDVFFRELRNLPISTADSAFQDSYYKYYNLPLERTFRPERDLKLTDADVQMDKNIETIVILDPAKTVKIHSAESAVVGIGIDVTNARVFIRDIVSEKMYPDEIYDAFFGMAISLGANVVGIEETSLNEFIKQPVKNEMFKRATTGKGKFFEIIWLKARGGEKGEKGKILRIKELVPYYRMGYVYHNASCPKVKNLEQQLRVFPRSKLWDIMDAVAYFISMLEIGARYFAPDNEDRSDPESEFRQLEYEDIVENWRIA